MGTLADFFLRAKHWQIFLLLFGVGYADEFMVSELSTLRSGDPRLWLLGAVLALETLVFVSWFWCIGFFLRSIVRPTLMPKTRFFGVAVVYPVIYAFCVPALFVSFNSAPMAVILPLHLFAMVCLIYLLCFVSKCLALVETGRAESFSDFAVTFFLLCFYPIGVWIIQPKVNRLYLAEVGPSPSAS